MGQLAKLIVTLKPLLPFALVGIILLSLGILVYLFVIIRAARKRQALQDSQGVEIAAAEDPKKGGSARPPVEAIPPSGELRQTFARSIKLLKAHAAGKNYRYEIPWFMILGEVESGKTTALRNTDLYLPLGEPYEDGFVQQGCNWWFFDKGVVLDVAGDYVLRPDGVTSDEKGWNSLLKLLQRYRPERPIDGVVLTIPCTDLIQAQPMSDQDRARVKERADLLYKKLWHAQKALGICFPVYLLVTKCDQVTGFKSFCSEIPPQRRQDIFGWSSPYVLEAGFTPEWVDEAFQNLLGSLYQAQSELFTEVREVKDSDGLFLFPSEFQSMLETLRISLNQIFRPSVYHESFFFRGLYFCGDGQGGPASRPLDADQPPLSAGPAEAGAGFPSQPETLTPAPDLSVSAPPPRPYFLKDLFEKKVFPEHGLARPSQQTISSRNVSMMVVQGLLALTVLVGGLGLWRGYGKLKGQIKTLEPVLRSVAADLKKTREPVSLTNEAERQAHQRKASLDLLQGMASANANRLRSAFFPSTWFSSIHRDIGYSVSLAYDEIILKSIFVSLNQKVKDILNRDRRVVSVDTTGTERFEVVPLEEIPEFVALRNYVEEITELERHSAVYNGLKSSKELSDLSHLVQYLYGIELPPDFYQNAEYYHGALGEAKYRLFETTALKGQAAGNARELVRRLYDRLFENNVLKAYLEDIAAQLEGLEQQRGRSSQEDIRFQDLLDTLTDTEAALSRPELAWVFEPALDLGPAFHQVLDTFEASVLLGADLRTETETSGEKAFQRLRAELTTYETSLTGPILQNTGDQLVLSPRIASLKAVLGDYLSREASRGPMRALRTEIPPGMRLIWDTGLLEAAIQLSENPPAGDALRVFPLTWQNTIKRMASTRLRARMVDTVAQAQTFEPNLEGGARVSEEDIRPEVRNFKEAARFLAVLLNQFDRMGFSDAYNDLSDLAVAQASHLLTSVDKLMENEELYEVGDFSAWDGRQPLSPVVFGARDAADMNYYLDVQRERIKYIADEYADPLIAFLGNSRVARGQVYVPVLSKWQRILAELRKYDNKKPGNSLAALEGFILTDMDQITLENFSEKLKASDLAEQSGDLFLQKRNRLRREIYARCQEVAENQMVTGYAAVERFFNQTLGGKFPFSRGDAGGAGAEADLDDVQEFYRLYDRYVRIDREFLKRNKKFGASTDGPLEFLYQMDKVRGFLQAFGAGDEKDQIPAVDLDVEFRANLRSEVGGNQIMDWTLEVGDQKISARDVERKGRWHFGDPIRLVLRWAKDAPDAPVFAGGRGVRVEDRTVIYEYPNRWSLFSLLKDRASSSTDFGSFVDPKPYTLKFVIETRSSSKGDKKEATGASQTKVFIRVTPVSADQKERLVLPVFPEKAPPLNQEKVSKNE